MRNLKNWTLSALLGGAMITTSCAEATILSRNGYEQCRRAPSLAPTYAMAAIAGTAFVALILLHGSCSSH